MNVHFISQYAGAVRNVILTWPPILSSFPARDGIVIRSFEPGPSSCPTGLPRLRSARRVSRRLTYLQILRESKGSPPTGHHGLHISIRPRSKAAAMLLKPGPVVNSPRTITCFEALLLKDVIVKLTRTTPVVSSSSACPGTAPASRMCSRAFPC